MLVKPLSQVLLALSWCWICRAKPCIPDEDQTYLAIGQDYHSIGNYTDAIKVLPHGVMSYTSLQGISDSSSSLEEPVDYGAGVQWAQGLAERYPTAFLQLGLWLVDTCDRVTAREYDEEIDKLASFLVGLKIPVFLRIGYEFDSQENHYDAQDYQSAFRYIVDRFRYLNADNVAFVWHASGFAPRDNLSVDSWFPGDDYVDWCGLSFFQQPYDCQVSVKCIMKDAERLAKFCDKEGIPLMIAESTPYGGIIDEADSSHGPNRAGFYGSTWNRWFVPVLDFVINHDVKMWSYINCNWDSQVMWQKQRAKHEHWGDSRIQKFKGIKKRWVKDVVGSNRFSWVVNRSTVISGEDESESPLFTESRHRRPSSNVCNEVVVDVAPYPWKAVMILSISGVVLVGAGALYLTKLYRRRMSNEYVVIG